MPAMLKHIDAERGSAADRVLSGLLYKQPIFALGFATLGVKSDTCVPVCAADQIIFGSGLKPCLCWCSKLLPLSSKPAIL